MSSTELVCSATTFLDELETINNSTFVTATTAMIDDDVSVFTAVLGKGIELTKKTDKGLINTNHCRSFGVQYIDDPTYPKRKLGFYANNVFLPLFMQGNNCLVDSFCLSDNEMRQFPWVFMIDEESWYPSDVTQPTISAMSQTIKEEADPVGSRSTKTLSISNEAI